jgi:hypothetical protein
MPVSPTDVANLALGHIAAVPIADLNENSAQARLANRLFWPTADECLADHPWNFATLWSGALAVSTDRVASPEWAFYFALPTEPFCLVVRDTSLGTQPGLWAREAQFIGTDSSTLQVKYTARITDTGLWAPHFVTAFSYLLASKMAYAISKSTNLADMMFKVYEGRLSRARGVNGLESPARTVRSSSLTDVR